ncbi:MAG TPA: formylglycine-generating enzyme family protein [Chthoniobacterales bacterium]|jgi:formylglycine-generating enzyme required for sulfatase activity|nr:formylglycine-generating enzyme family protein [Chthoniobacterales bacterium]
MLAVSAAPPTFPDDPRKWDGWRNYDSDNPYVRLCLDPSTQPGDEEVQTHCTALLQWWQNKLPLKNQPANPMAQLLGRGIDDAPIALVQARMDLLDPERRRQWDATLAEQAEQDALDEFIKFIGFSIKGGVLPAEAEVYLVEFGQNAGLGDDQIKACIEEELKRKGARRSRLVPAPAPPAAPPVVSSRVEAEKEYLRILCLGALNMASATYTVRAMLAQVAENLGIAPARGEELLDRYLEDQELLLAKPGNCKPVIKLPPKNSAPATVAEVSAKQVADFAPALRPTVSDLPGSFATSVGGTMVLLPAGEFIMGSDAPDAQPNEQPLTPVSLSTFYIAQHPITNAQYEQFDPKHKQKRMGGAGADHPVVYVTSFEAVKFCEWLGQKDGRSYRLPTEAEWEYAARGIDGRKYPWGNQSGRDLANFADASTSFPWRDMQVNDGYPETSPVGAFPRGASFFAIEDMAGNVWEWCLDFYQDLAGAPKQNPRGPASGPKRVYRGGSWKSRFTNLRASARATNAPNYSCNDLGFRIVCEIERGEG